MQQYIQNSTKGRPSNTRTLWNICKIRNGRVSVYSHLNLPQDECVETTGCRHFMFTEFSSGDTECFLLRSCDANSTYSCSAEPQCLMAVSGPATPSLVESCCEGFQDVSCEANYIVGQEFDVFSEQECQQMCRDKRDCAYWTLYGGVCFFYSDCGTPEVHLKKQNFQRIHIFLQACTSCTSGAAFPDMSTCASHQVT